jgi:hypothetical protein
MTGKPTELGPVQAGDLDKILNDQPLPPGPETGSKATILLKGEGEGEPKFCHFQGHSLLTAAASTDPTANPICLRTFSSNRDTSKTLPS